MNFLVLDRHILNHGYNPDESSMSFSIPLKTVFGILLVLDREDENKQVKHPYVGNILDSDIP